MIDMTDNDFDRSRGDGRRPPPTTPEIIVGVDDNARSGEVLLCAARQSRLTGLPLRVVHVWQMSAPVSVAARPGHQPYWAAAAADARARVTRRVVETLGGRTDVRWTLEVIQGAPGPALVARSATARLLVFGTGEHAGVRRTTAGSVSRYCMANATPPTLSVPARAVVPEKLSSHWAGAAGVL
jgi:nucleotide-binding universal stress UspA family protein